MVSITWYWPSMGVSESSIYLKVQVVRADEGGLPANVDIFEKYPGGHVYFPLTGETKQFSFFLSTKS